VPDSQTESILAAFERVAFRDTGVRPPVARAVDHALKRVSERAVEDARRLLSAVSAWVDEERAPDAKVAERFAIARDLCALPEDFPEALRQSIARAALEDRLEKVPQLLKSFRKTDVLDALRAATMLRDVIPPSFPTAWADALDPLPDPPKAPVVGKSGAASLVKIVIALVAIVVLGYWRASSRSYRSKVTTLPTLPTFVEVPRVDWSKYPWTPPDPADAAIEPNASRDEIGKSAYDTSYALMKKARDNGKPQIALDAEGVSYAVFVDKTCPLITERMMMLRKSLGLAKPDGGPADAGRDDELIHLMRALEAKVARLCTP